MKIKPVSLAGALIILSGCALRAGESHQSVRYYDLGPASASHAACPGNLQPRRIRTHASLQGNRMWYRYDATPYEVLPFAISRWSAPPAALLSRQLSPLFSVEKGQSPAMLDLELLRMELQISKDSIARTALLINAQIYQDQHLIAQKQFVLNKDAIASPEGAAHALAESVREWAASMCEWAKSIQP